MTYTEAIAKAVEDAKQDGEAQVIVAHFDLITKIYGYVVYTWESNLGHDYEAYVAVDGTVDEEPFHFL